MLCRQIKILDRVSFLNALALDQWHKKKNPDRHIDSVLKLMLKINWKTPRFCERPYLTVHGHSSIVVRLARRSDFSVLKCQYVGSSYSKESRPESEYRSKTL